MIRLCYLAILVLISYPLEEHLHISLDKGKRGLLTFMVILTNQDLSVNKLFFEIKYSAYLCQY